MENLQIDSKFADQTGEIMVVELGGHVDQSNSYQLERLFDNIIGSGCYRVILDFSKVYYISSAGWGVFVGEIKRFRDRGGDLKLANMNPDVYEVYQMLEFYHILDDYASVEEAAASFKQDQEELDMVIKAIGEGKRTAPDHKPLKAAEEKVEELELEDLEDDSAPVMKRPQVKERTEIRRQTSKEFKPSFLQTEVKVAELPLPEKIKKVIAQNPLIGLWGIRKILRHEHFGRTRIGPIRLYRILRDLDLDTRAKRYRFYRSC